MFSSHRRFLLLCSLPVFSLPMPLAAQVTGRVETGPDHEHAEEENDYIIVQGTRLNRRVQDEPIRVEVIAGEEIEEKAIMPYRETRP